MVRLDAERKLKKNKIKLKERKWREEKIKEKIYFSLLLFACKENEKKEN